MVKNSSHPCNHLGNPDSAIRDQDRVKDDDWGNLGFDSPPLATCTNLAKRIPPLRPVVGAQRSFRSLGDIWQHLETLLVVTSSGRGVKWELVGERPGMLLNVLRCTGRPPTTRNHSARCVTSPGLRNSALDTPLNFFILTPLN